MFVQVIVVCIYLFLRYDWPFGLITGGVIILYFFFTFTTTVRTATRELRVEWSGVAGWDTAGGNATRHGTTATHKIRVIDWWQSHAGLARQVQTSHERER